MQEAEKWQSGKVEALVAKLLWAESNHQSPHSKGEEASPVDLPEPGVEPGNQSNINQFIYIYIYLFIYFPTPLIRLPFKTFGCYVTYLQL